MGIVTYETAQNINKICYMTKSKYANTHKEFCYFYKVNVSERDFMNIYRIVNKFMFDPHFDYNCFIIEWKKDNICIQFCNEKMDSSLYKFVNNTFRVSEQ